MTTAAILIIGNEILSGRTQDTNVSYIAKRLMDRGITLEEVRIIPDKEDVIISVIRDLKKYNLLFTTGGIGITHDDITKECVAKALNLPLVENQQVLNILKNHYKERFNENRRGMALMPPCAQIIPNSVSHIPSFSIENIYVLAGMPSVMKAMFDAIEATLPMHDPILSLSKTYALLEGDIAHILSLIQDKYVHVELGSYPFYAPYPGVDLVMKGKNKEELEKAFHDLHESLKPFLLSPK